MAKLQSHPSCGHGNGLVPGGICVKACTRSKWPFTNDSGHSSHYHQPHLEGGDSPDRPWLDHVHPDASSDEQPSRTSSHSPPCHKRMVGPLLKDVSVNENEDV